MFANITAVVKIGPIQKINKWVAHTQRNCEQYRRMKRANCSAGVQKYGSSLRMRAFATQNSGCDDAERRRGDPRVVVADFEKDAWEVADALSEVFDQEWTWAPGWLPRVMRVFQYSSLHRRQHKLQADKTLALFVPKCANRQTYLVSVGEQPTPSPQRASDERAANRTPVLVKAIVDTYVRQQASKTVDSRKDSNKQQGSITQEDEGHEKSAFGVVCLDTLTEFAPPKVQPRGVSDPLWGPHRYERRKIGYISNLVVRSEYRRQGIGKQLLDAAERCAMDWGCRSIGLHCAADNKGAMSMYQACGFRFVANEYPADYISFPEWVLERAGVPKSEVFLIKRLKY